MWGINRTTGDLSFDTSGLTAARGADPVGSSGWTAGHFPQHSFFITEAETHSGTVESTFIGKCRWPLLSPCSFGSLSSPQYCCNKFSPCNIFWSKTSHSKPAVILSIKSIHRTAEKVDISISKYKRVCIEGTSLIQLYYTAQHSPGKLFSALGASGTVGMSSTTLGLVPALFDSFLLFL